MRDGLETAKGFSSGVGSRRLVVMLHALGQTGAALGPIAEMVRSEMSDADVWIPELPIRHFLSRARGRDILDRLIAEIDRAVTQREGLEDGGRYEGIVLIGHSYGAVLARAIWAEAMGGLSDGTADLTLAKPWARRIERIVLLAAVARGWNSLAPLSTSVRVAVWAGEIIETLAGPGFAALDLRRGAPFITTVRLQSLSVLEALRHSGERPPETVQLLGSEDDVVAPADAIDLATGAGFHYLELPRTNHLSLLDLFGAAGAVRRERLALALAGTREDLLRECVPPDVMADVVDDALDDHDLGNVEPLGEPGGAPIAARREVRAIVFVMHGIRDYGYWTRKLAVRVKRRAREAGLSCRTVTSSYGFFPMGPFLLLPERRRRAGWLMDQYVTARALYPEAESFHYVGHSNGTYLLAAALASCRAIRFDNIVFAGSVVRPDFAWERMLRPTDGLLPQARSVLNFVATDDVVVATVPGGLGAVGLADLGGAGHVGFAERPGVRNVDFVPGGHGAALADHHWDEIAEFVLSGTARQERPEDLGSEPPLRARPQRRRTVVMGRLAPVLLLVVPLAVFAFALFVLWVGAAGGFLGFGAALLLLTWMATKILKHL